MKFVFGSFVLSGFVLSDFIFSLAGAIVGMTPGSAGLAIVLDRSVDPGDGFIDEDLRTISAFGGCPCTQAIKTSTIEPGKNNRNDLQK